ncbi:MAG: polyribonucleotide nucleotidyltransferase [Kiritimatiellae bacterium]|nr:polyribonucleotide nucleotidyltransferase [Kiritimatiellia bacterium]
MNDTKSVTIDVGGATMTIETGLLARQAAGATTVRLGDSMVFSAVTCTDKPREGIDFFPLQVEYREKFYAAGKFPGGYFKREARPTEREILCARITDRPIRPLFPEGYYNDVQVNNMVISADGENETDTLAVNAASASLTISEIPFMGPIGAVRIGRINGEFVINPTQKQRKESDLDLIYAGTRERFLMMEGSAKEITEEDFLAAMKRAHVEVVKIIDAQLELRRLLGKPDKHVEDGKLDAEKMQFLYDNGADALRKALLVPGKLDREGQVKAIRDDLLAKMKEKWPEEIDDVTFVHFFDAMEIDLVRKNVLEDGKRIDGRGLDELRPLYAQLDILPRAHGSAIFERGETSAMGSVTLGTRKDAQEMDAVTGGPSSKSFILHYNFPPYCTGEVGRLGSTGRREIGHGALAERSLAQVVPEDFPYSIRVVSDIMGSNGSSSMATVCVGTLAMEAAGIPLKAPVAGISIGLFTTPDESKKILVTDILGAEDHCGDMDFKVAGTRKGITGFQVDLKIRGLTWDLVEGALQKAKVARGQILDFIESKIAGPRADLSPYAPRIVSMQIPKDKIGALIGPGGANIRSICELSGAQIDIVEEGDYGNVHIYANSAEALKIAQDKVAEVAAEAEEGKLYEGTVTGIKEFGVFVEILPGIEGLCHISEMADRRINRCEDICKMGDKMMVKCIGINDRGQVKLSRKQAMRELDAQKNP